MRRPAPLLRAAAACLTVGLGIGLTACTDGPTPLPTPAPSPSAPSPSAPSPSDPAPTPSAEAGVRVPVVVVVTAGSVVLDVLVHGDRIDRPHVSVNKAGADAATLTFDLTDSPVRTPVDLALSSAGSVTVNSDGSVTVFDDAGTAVGGLTRPSPGALFTAPDETHLQLTRPDVPVDTGEVTTTLGSVAVASTDWGEREGGRSLAVEPTRWMREAGQAGWAVAWAQVVAAEPEADSPGMYDQLVCHAVGAPDKETWNLEPWRPDVGLVAVMAAGCNPSPRG